MIESQPPSLPTERRHSRTKVAFHDHGPLSRGTPVDLRMDRDVVTDTMSRALNPDQGSVERHNATRKQHGTSPVTPECSSSKLPRSPRTRRLHASNTPDLTPNLDTVASLQEARGVSTASTSPSEAAIAGNASVNTSRGFRARLMFSQARKTIQNHDLVWSDTARKRSRQRTPFIMDIVLELKAQYAGYTTEDMYVIFEAMRRKEDARPVFEYLAHDFSAGAGSVDAYWDSHARIWRDWKTPADECVDGVVTCGSTFPAGHSPEPAPVTVGVPQNLRATPPSSSLCLGHTSFPDSIERSTAFWCPVLNCDSVAGYHSDPHESIASE